jgi:hypothetical protein
LVLGRIVWNFFFEYLGFSLFVLAYGWNIWELWKLLDVSTSFREILKIPPNISLSN